MTPFVDFCPWPATIKIVDSPEPLTVGLAGIQFLFDDEGILESTPTVHAYEIELERFSYIFEDYIIECHYGWVVYANEIYIAMTEPYYVDC
jgi:hypothetical protein